MWVVAFCLGQVFFNRGLNWRYKAFMVLISVLWFYYSFFIVGNWLSGWAVLLVITLVMTALRSPRLLLVFLLLLMVWALFNLEMFEEMFTAESEESGSTRLEAWNTNLLMTNGHWFLGTGPAGYAAYYLTYIPNDAMATHSNYIDVLAQFGLVGLSIMVVLLLSVMWKGFKAFRAIPGGGFLQGFAASMVAASVGFTVAMALGDWVIPFPYTQGIVAFGHTVWCWMAMGTIAALEYKYRDRGKPRQRPERPRPDDAHDAKKSLTAGVN
ncbi:MAG: O-antigen ligase family protein [Anaerolineae bacterium]|nr:O-antigen ligase family protein [Anaerolineae bacterium]